MAKTEYKNKIETHFMRDKRTEWGRKLVNINEAAEANLSNTFNHLFSWFEIHNFIHIVFISGVLHGKWRRHVFLCVCTVDK